MQHIHILGICGTFMGSLAQLAKAKGYRVTGSDLHVYPPMSTQLEAAGIELIEGFDIAQLDDEPDLVVVGNVISRGNPVIEEILNRGLPYISGPQWLAEHILRDRWVLAVSGTHGKTTTATMLTWILEYAGYEPGYLIGGVPQNFETSARYSESSFFVVEADEYDSAFFDKRSKFVHYKPRTLVMNNLEFDHADIFPDLKAIQTQFHHLVRTVPADGLLIYPSEDAALKEVIELGCWTPQQQLGRDWLFLPVREDGSEFDIVFDGQECGKVTWPLTGHHNMSNAIAAMAAARHVGVEPHISCQALSEFQGVKRRMELLSTVNGIAVYDDFAHHPTAIATTLEGLRAKAPDAKITAIIEPRSNTMKMGFHQNTLLQSSAQADTVYWMEPEQMKWSIADSIGTEGGPTKHVVCQSTADIIEQTVVNSTPGEQIVVMSNGGFNGIHGDLIQALQKRYE